MHFLLRWLIALVLGVAIGLGSLYYLTFQARPTELIANGIWRTNPLVGTSGDDAYSRLYIAITSILALNRSESIYFEARTDADGGALSAACDYTLSGLPPAARWWSVTAYGPNDRLIPNEAGRYATGTASAETKADGSVDIALTPDGSGPNGIATGTGRFVLLLRLYQPSPDVVAALGTAPLFSLTKGSCRA